MRSISSSLAVLAILGVAAGCSATGARAARAPSPGAVTADVVAPRTGGGTLARASGPVDTGSLARELGMRAEPAGPGILLTGSDVRARVFPGSDRMTIDGSTVAMGAPARREGPYVIVPADGADALRSAVATAASRRATLARVLAPVATPVVRIAPRPATVVLAPPPTPAARPTAGGEPTWVPSSSERAWRYVVVHHSDDREGACAKYDAVHRGKGWENGCGYHWIIGNGTQSGDGEIEAGPRWERQIQGAHTKTADNRFNEEGIGIVLVGDFEHGGAPTARQYDSLVRLTRWLTHRYGIPADGVRRHSDCKATACPGKNFPWTRYLADVAR